MPVRRGPGPANGHPDFILVVPGCADLAPAGLPPEEARLLYVAMTRATRELVVSGVG